MKKVISKMSNIWYLYLIVAILLITIWTSVFKNLKEPNKNEKLVISYFGNNLDNLALKEDLTNNIATFSTQNIKKIAITCHEADNKIYFKQVLISQIYQCDLVIVESSLVDENFGNAYFKTLDTSLIENYYSNVTYYKEDEKAYGILLDASVNNIFNQYIKEKENHYLFVSYNSYNVKKMYNIGNENDDVALKVISYFLKEMD